MIRRCLLLAVALIAFGVPLVGSLTANPTAIQPTGGSQSVSVHPIDEALLVGYLDNHDPVIPANGAPQRVDDVWGAEADPDYAIGVSAVAIAGQGIHTPAAACAGISPSRYSVVPSVAYPTGDLIDGPVGMKVAELKLTLPPSVTDLCQVSGGKVEITFQAVSGIDN